jgi:hypothetical protein
LIQQLQQLAGGSLQGALLLLHCSLQCRMARLQLLQLCCISDNTTRCCHCRNSTLQLLLVLLLLC